MSDRVPQAGDFVLVVGDSGLSYQFPRTYLPVVRDIVPCSWNDDNWNRGSGDSDHSINDNEVVRVVPRDDPEDYIDVYPKEFIYLTKKENTIMPTNPCPCLNCRTEITDPNFRVVLYNEDYPEVEIGPYCERCYALLKVCSGCQHAVLASETTHTGGGEHYCRHCMADFSVCEDCGTQKPSNAIKEVDRRKICSSCLSKNYKLCGCCNTYKKKDTIVSANSLEGMRRAGIFRKYGSSVCSECFEAKKRAFKLYEVESCSHCGKNYSYSEGQISPKKYCPRCWDTFKTCTVCNSKHPNIRTREYINDEGDLTKAVMCDYCSEKNLFECDCCHRACLSKTKKYVKGSMRVHTVCSKCATGKECSNCSTLFSGSGDMCEHCKSAYVSNTCSCGRIRDERHACRVCNGMGIYNYSHKPRVFFNYSKEKEIKRGNIFFGFENECTFGSSSSKMENRLKEMYAAYDPTVVVAKSDGSISGAGYEVVTQPMSLLFFHKMDLGPLLPEGIKKDDSCGLHIHVGRDSFVSEVHLYKVINFLHSNPTFTTYVAGRSFNGYCAKLKSKPSKHLKDSKRGNTERRAMVNLTNRTTVEFRLFAGCVSEYELRSKVEFLHALITFQKEVPIHLSKDLASFKSFIEMSSKTYPNGSAFIQKYNG